MHGSREYNREGQGLRESQEEERPFITKCVDPPRKDPLPSSSHILTSKEKKCTCCLLHPVGTNASPWCSSRESPRISDLILKDVLNRPNISFQASKNLNCNGKWEAWVRKMSSNEKFVQVWRDAGIHDAIVVASVCGDIKIDQKVMEALFGFWSMETNTFAFSWGEATVTVEDAHVLSGLPLAGSELDRPLTKEEEKLQMRLVLEMKKMLEMNDTDGIISYDFWLEWFMDEKNQDIDAELMHLGFLTCWLSKDVFPTSDPAQDAAFGLAVRLSLGEKISLAPSLVANIYHNLNTMTELLIQGKKTKRREQVKAWASFSLLQCWIWERFEFLRPATSPNVLPRQSRTRISRWSGRQSKNSYEEAVRIFQDETQFTWRPYSRIMGQWIEPEWYSTEPQTVALSGKCVPSYVHDFLSVISCAKLKGICEDGYVFSENYNPHRVSRQFGFDQGIPEAELTYEQPNSKKLKIFIPARTRFGNTREEYMKWWSSCRASYDDILNAFSTENNDNRKKRKAEEMGKNVVGGCKHQKVCDSCNDTSHHHPLYSSLQLLREEGNVADTIAPDDDDDDEVVIIDELPPKSAKKEKTVPVDNNDEGFLVDELNKFVSLGLMMWQEGGIDTPCKDRYGQEAIDHYPNFFKLIPQRPHYKGILEGKNLDEDLKSDILLGQWYLLVDLMGEALKTNEMTNAADIEKMIQKAQKLEKSGFDVRHIIARLRSAQKAIMKQQ